MKQYQLDQVKFPKTVSPDAQAHKTEQTTTETSQGHSEMIRIIIALLIAIFIYNQSQQTTINYTEIIKNQKMFLVKNIRGVLPTLGGNVKHLQNSWRVVHFQNYHENDSQLFVNYIFTFNKSNLVIQDKYCNLKLEYNWKNYSYNIDLQQIQKISKNLNQNDLQQQDIGPDTHSSNSIETKLQTQNKTEVSLQKSDTSSDALKKVRQNKLKAEEQAHRKQMCQRNSLLFQQVIKHTSVWTISDKNLYLLLENTHLKEDYYMILQVLDV